MHFETLTELKNKDCEELLVPDANSHHQEQEKRPVMTEQEFVKDTVNKSPMKDIAKVGLCYAFLHGKRMLGTSCKFRHDSVTNNERRPNVGTEQSEYPCENAAPCIMIDDVQTSL